MDQNDEHTFLCGYQRIRRYGSTSDLNSSSTNFKKPFSYIIHKVQPTDTLQSLEMKYNSNMYEIKRVNRLWSNDSLYCKTMINIPIYDETNSSKSAPESHVTSPENENIKKSKIKMKIGQSLEIVEEKQESLDDFFKRIDSNMRKTQKIVKKLNKKKINEME